VELYIHSYIRLHDVYTDLTKKKMYIIEYSEHVDPISAVRIQHMSQEIHVPYPSATDQHKFPHHFFLLERNFGAQSDKVKVKVKVKFNLLQATRALTSALDGGGWSTPRPGGFTPGKETR